MKMANFVLKIVAMSLGAAALICAVIAYWDKLDMIGVNVKKKRQRCTLPSEYDDYEE